MYLVGFCFVWIIPLTDRLYQAIFLETNKWLSLLHSATAPLQGFANAVIYIAIHRRVELVGQTPLLPHDNLLSY